jgi:hypothetical protein
MPFIKNPFGTGPVDSFLQGLHKIGIRLTLIGDERTSLQTMDYRDRIRLYKLIEEINKHGNWLHEDPPLFENINFLIKFSSKYGIKLLKALCNAIKPIGLRHLSSDDYTQLRSTLEKCMENDVKLSIFSDDIIDFIKGHRSVFFSIDARSLEYISQILSKLSCAGLKGQIDPLLVKNNDFTLLKRDSFYTKTTLFAHLIVISALANAGLLINKENIIKCFSPNSLLFTCEPEAIEWFFLLFIADSRIRTLTQARLDGFFEASRNLEAVNRNLESAGTSVADLAVELKHRPAGLAEQFNLSCDPKIVEEYQSLGIHWWASALSGYTPESLLAQIKDNNIQVVISKQQLYQILLLGIKETQFFLKSIALFKNFAKDNKSILSDAYKAITNFARFITLVEDKKYTFSELYETLQAVTSSLSLDDMQKGNLGYLLPEWLELMHSFTSSTAREDFLRIFHTLKVKLNYNHCFTLDNLKILLSLQDKEASFPELRQFVAQVKGSQEGSNCFFFLDLEDLCALSKPRLILALQIIRILSEAGLDQISNYDRHLYWALLKDGSRFQKIKDEYELLTMFIVLSCLQAAQLLSSSNLEAFSKKMSRVSTDCSEAIILDQGTLPLFSMFFIFRLVTSAAENGLTQTELTQILSDEDYWKYQTNGVNLLAAAVDQIQHTSLGEKIREVCTALQETRQTETADSAEVVAPPSYAAAVNSTQPRP